MKLTLVVPSRFCPVIVTIELGGAFVGEKLVRIGCRKKIFALVTLPSTVVIMIGALVALFGTCAVSWLKVTPETMAAFRPPNFTFKPAAVKLAPVTMTLVPGRPNWGENPVMVGSTTKLLALALAPPSVITRNGLVMTLVGTVTCIEPLVTLKGTTLSENAPPVPPNWTWLAEEKFVPTMVRFVRVRPLAGEKPLMTGGP